MLLSLDYEVMKRPLLSILVLLAAMLPSLVEAQTTPVQAFEPLPANANPPGISDGTATCAATDSTLAAAPKFLYDASAATLSAEVLADPNDSATDGIQVGYEMTVRRCFRAPCTQVSDWRGWRSVGGKFGHVISARENLSAYIFDAANHPSADQQYQVFNARAVRSRPGRTMEIAGRYLEYKNGLSNNPSCGPWRNDIINLAPKFSSAAHTFDIQEHDDYHTQVISATRNTFGSNDSATIPNLNLTRQDGVIYSPLGLYKLTGDVPEGMQITDDGVLAYVGTGLDFDTGASPKNAYTFTITADNRNNPYPNPPPASASDAAKANGGTDTTTVTLNVTKKTGETAQVTGMTNTSVTPNQVITVEELRANELAGIPGPYFEIRALRVYPYDFTVQSLENEGGEIQKWGYLRYEGENLLFFPPGSVTSIWPNLVEGGKEHVNKGGNNLRVQYFDQYDVCTDTWPYTACRGKAGHDQFRVRASADDGPVSDVRAPFGPRAVFDLFILPNRGPEFKASSLAFALAENTPGNTNAVTLGTVVATDAEGDVVRYCLATPTAADCPLDDGNPDFDLTPAGVLTYTGTGEDPETIPTHTLSIYAESTASSSADNTYWYPKENKDTDAFCAPCRRVPATVTVTVGGAQNPPVADAGDDQIVSLRQKVTLDGTGSSDPNGGQSLNYVWTQVANADGDTFSGTPVQLIGGATDTATFTAPSAATTLYFRLTVTDTLATPESDIDVATIIVANNNLPTADAGADKSVMINTAGVSLRGSGTTGDSGQTLSYDWVQVANAAGDPLSGTGVTLAAANTATATFTAPGTATTLYFKLTVTDDHPAMGKASDIVAVYVLTSNSVPVADAGPDQKVQVGRDVTLAGTATDLNRFQTLSYAWVQVADASGGTFSGSGVSLVDADKLSASFTAPTGATTLYFQLTVTDNFLPTAGAHTDIVAIEVLANRPPTASASAPPSVWTGMRDVMLDGTGSSDPDTADFGQTIAGYLWEQVDSDGTAYSGNARVTLEDADTAEATFDAPSSPTTLHFKLTVVDDYQDVGGAADKASDTAMVTTTVETDTSVTNVAPVADAGADQSVMVSTSGSPVTVMLRGSGTDADAGQTLSYAWTQVANASGGTFSGTPVQLTGDTTANASFRAPTTAAMLYFQLTVTDDATPAASGTDIVLIDVLTSNSLPVAGAGPDQKVQVGRGVTLAGTATDANTGQTLSYAWVQVADASGGTFSGSGVSLGDADKLSASFTAPTAAATLYFQLTVTDSFLPTAGAHTDIVVIEVLANRPPTASASAPASVWTGAQDVMLDGTGSSDPDIADFGQTLSYLWEQVDSDGTAYSGSTRVTLEDAATAEAAFDAPSSPTTLHFKLTVADDYRDAGGTADKASDTALVTITMATNVAPVADAGADQSVMVSTSASPVTVMLRGSGTDADNGQTVVGYAWAQVASASGGTFSGTPVQLTGGTTANASFRAPTTPATLYFQLTVMDDATPPASGTDIVRIDVLASNSAPVVNAGPDQKVQIGEAVSLAGTATDVNTGQILRYAWTQVDSGGTALGSSAPAKVTLRNADQAAASFDAPATAAMLYFRLTVTDNFSLPASGTDTVAIDVLANRAPIAVVVAAPKVLVGTTGVSLASTGSGDADVADFGQTLSYAWAQVNADGTDYSGGTTVSLTGASNATASFDAPSSPATLYFQLTVTDDYEDAGGTAANASTSAVATIEVVANRAPVASAGENRDVMVGKTGVALNGSGSDADVADFGQTLSYAWAQVDADGTDYSGSTAVSLTDASTASASFDVPTSPVTLYFQLTVTDDYSPPASGTDLVAINVAANWPPVASAGEDQNVIAGVMVTLDGSGSSDPEKQALSYRWSQVADASSPTVTLAAASSMRTTFMADTSLITDGEATLHFKLTVTDTFNSSATDRVSVTIKPPSLAEVIQGVQAKQVLSLVIDVNSALSGRLGAISMGHTSTLEPDGTAFSMPLNGTGAGAGSFGVWGLVESRGLSDSSKRFDWDGDSSSSSHFGFDYQFNDYGVFGVLASTTDGSFDFQDRISGSGTIDSNISGHHPYFGWNFKSGMNIWGSFGYGDGGLIVTTPAGVFRSNTRLGSLLLGVSRPLVSGAKIDFSVKAEYSAATVDIDGSSDGFIEPLSARTAQFKLTSQFSLPPKSSTGTLLTPSLDLALRSDGGDGSTGSGLEVGINLDYVSGNGFLTLLGGLRTLLTDVGDYEEMGAHLLVRLSAGGGRGLYFTLAPSYGDTASNAEQLWSGNLSALSSGTALEPEQHMGAEIGYGLSVPGGSLVLIPYSGSKWQANGSRSVFAGAKLLKGRSASLSLRSEHSEAVSGLSDSRTVLTGTVNF